MFGKRRWRARHSPTSRACTGCASRRGGCAPRSRSSARAWIASARRRRSADVKALAAALGERRDRDVQLELLEQLHQRTDGAERRAVELLSLELRDEQRAANRASRQGARAHAGATACASGSRGSRDEGAPHRRARRRRCRSAHAARRIVAVRTAELYAFVPEALGRARRDARCTTCGSPRSACATCSSSSASASARSAPEAQQRARGAPGRARRDPRLRRDARADRLQPRARARPVSTRSPTASATSGRSSSPRSRGLWETIAASRLRERLLAHTISSPVEVAGRRIIERR